MTHPSRKPRHSDRHGVQFLPRRTALATAVAMTFGTPALAQTLPTGGTVVSGSIAIGAPAGGAMTITQTSNAGIINWNGFSIGAGGTVTFAQPSASAVTLNRVTGATASQIDGTLAANGRIFLVNPNGVLFGGGAQVDVGGLVASTLAITDADFNTGVTSGRFQFTGDGASNVTNAGRITAANGGLVALLGAADNQNGGSITANGGSVLLGNGPNIVVDYNGDGLSKLVITGNALRNAVVMNEGTLQADGGTVALAGTASSLGTLVVNQTGVIRAQTVNNVGGRIFLTGSTTGGVIAGGTLDASATAAGDSGGTIALTGASIVVGNAPTTINATGAGSGSNGRFTVDAYNDLTLGAASAAPTGTGYFTAFVADSAVASALSNGTDVTLASHLNGASGYGGNVLLNGATVSTTQLRDTTLQLEADRNVSAGQFQLTATGAAVTVNADADARAAGSGSIAINSSTLTTNGGSVQLYGGGDPLAGRARGSSTGSASGVSLFSTNIDTRNAAGGGNGNVVIRGAGLDTGTNGGDGVAIRYGSINTGAGNVVIDGIGGIGGIGVNIGGEDTFPNALLSTIATASGNVSITGVGGNDSPTRNVTSGSATGIQLATTGIRSGGDITLNGTGGSLQNSVDTYGGSGAILFLGAGDGIGLQGASLNAGSGRTLALTGIAGSDGLQQDSMGNQTFTSATGLRQIRDTSFGTNAGGYTEGLFAAGGAINIVATGGSVANSLGDIRMAVGASTANGSGTGGSIDIRGDLLHLVGSDTNNPAPTFDASGSAGNGSVTFSQNIVSPGNTLYVIPDTGVAAVPDYDGNGYIAAGALNSALNSSRTVTVNASGLTDVGAVALTHTAAGPVDLVFNSGEAFQGGVDTAGNAVAWSLTSPGGATNLSIVSNSTVRMQNGTVQTNGGNVSGTSINSNDIGIDIAATTIDTRVGQSAANASGSILLSGTAAQTGTRIASSTLSTSNGDLTVSGTATAGTTGVLIAPNLGGRIAAAGGATPSTLQSGSGNIRITGSSQGGAAGTVSYGVGIASSTVQSQSGHVDIAGYTSNAGDAASTTTPAAGVITLGAAATPVTLAGGAGTSVSGTSTAAGNGVYLGDNTAVASSAGNVLLRGSGANGTADVTATAAAQISAANLVDLRPGSVSAAGVASDAPATAINIGGTNGFAIDPALLAQINAPTIVIGSSAQTGAISVNAPVNLTHNLTLQTGGTGAISLGGTVNVGNNVLALVAGGDITQTAALTARSLVASSANGRVNLSNAGNAVSNNTVAGTAAGDFTFVDNQATTIGTVTSTTVDPVTGAPVTTTVSGITAGGAVRVQTTAGDLTLAAPVVAGSTIDLVTANTFQNTGPSTLTAPNGWTIWASTYTGETRGGLVGSGPLPNLYGCTFGVSCVRTPVAGNNTFVYQAQPVLFIGIDDQTREYGLANPAFTYTTAGLVNGDTLAAALAGTPTTAATAASNVGTYAITGGGFSSPAGYVFQVRNGVLAVTPATLTYVADPFTREYGLANPAFTGTVSGFRNGDTQTSATGGTLAFTSPATAGSNVGSYAINGSGLTATNYVFTQAAGNATALAITPATLTYIANTATREYGLANPLFGGTVTGFRNGDTQASATTGTLTFITPATAGSNVGSYAINGSGLAAGNYVFTQAAANATALAITPATLTYVADPFTREYGLANPAFTGAVTGFRNSDTVASSTTGALSFTSPATAASNVGSYAINGAGLTAVNYVFTQAATNAYALTVIPATLVYVADPVTRPLGSPNPGLGGTVTGFRNGDTLGSATAGTLVFTTTADPSSPVGSYGIFGSGLSAANYRFVQAPANATVFTVSEVPVATTFDFQREQPTTYLYDRNFGIAPACPPSTATDGDAAASASGDSLTHEWSLVRTRPNLSSCVQKDKKNSCSADF